MRHSGIDRDAFFVYRTKNKHCAMVKTALPDA